MLSIKTSDELKQTLARLLRERRVAAGFTQGQLATHCGCSRVTYSALESRGEGSVETLLKALHGLDTAQAVFDAITAQGVRPGRRRVKPSPPKGEAW